MKKFKIFLLLSILLCFGFTLSSEVHAEVETNITDLTGTKWLLNETNTLIGGDISFYETFNLSFLSNSNVYSSIHFQDRDYGGDFATGISYDTTLAFGYTGWTNEAFRTIEITGGTDVTNVQLIAWLESNATLSGYLLRKFEIGDILPAGYIKISWDFTDKFTDIFDYDVTFWINGDGDTENNLYIEIEVWDYGEEVRFTINQEEFPIDIPGQTVISIPIPYTIVQVDANNGYDYYDSIGDALMWEVVTEEEFIYDQGYQDGYSDGYSLGYKHARERYGYYDPNTDEWLSVVEYLNRYGTDKMDQTDFYNNFDKYFIPAMIIVFGGAIVLTILKVFKGRE